MCTKGSFIGVNTIWKCINRQEKGELLTMIYAIMTGKLEDQYKGNPLGHDQRPMVAIDVQTITVFSDSGNGS
jgi:hypothetical protein